MLIADHKNVSDGYFSPSFLLNGIENSDKPESNTYSRIGALDLDSFYKTDGGFTLKLIYRYHDGTQDILQWSQESWISDSNLSNANLFAVPSQSKQSTCTTFTGLMSSNNQQYAHMVGNEVPDCFWNAIGVTDNRYGGIPAFKGRIAFSSSLFMWKTQSAENVWRRQSRSLLSPGEYCMLRLTLLLSY